MKILKLLNLSILKNRQNVEQRVLSIQIDITNACNLSCAHCYHSNHRNNGVLSLVQWQDVLMQYKSLLKKLNRRASIIICGGEPTTSANLIPLLKYIKVNFGKTPITLLTNGTVLNDKILSALTEHESYIQISIDGPDSESHDSVRGLGSFSKSIRNVERYKAAGFSVSLLGILSKRTSLQIESFFKMARLLRVDRMKFTRFIPEGEGSRLLKNNLDRPLLPLELKGAYTEILENSRRFEVATNSNKALFNLIDDRLGEHEQFGFNGIVIDFKGNMKLSSRLPIVLGNLVGTETMENIFLNHQLMRDLRNPTKHECYGCPAFRRCGGSKNAAWAEYGDLFKKDPGCWLAQESMSKNLIRRTV